MKIIYQYRWWIVIVFSLMHFLFFYIFDVSPARKNIKLLIKQNTALSLDIKQQRLKPINGVKYEPIDVTSRLAYLSALASASGVILQSSVIHKTILHLQLQSTLDQLLKFFQQLNERHFAAVVTEYSYRTKGEMTIEIALLNGKNAAEKIGSVTMMRMTGYLQQRNRRSAMLSLPNGTTVDVSQGSVIGDENAVVEIIEPDHLEALLPNGKRIALKQC